MSNPNAGKHSGAFKKGGPSPNPGGLTKAQREARRTLREALDQRFTRPDGTDILVDALVRGVEDGDSTCIKLSCEYRYGKPVQPVELEPAQLSDGELRRALVEVADQWKEEEAIQ